MAPGAEDAFSYRIPALRLDGRIVLWYAAFARHYSMYPMGESLRRAFAADLHGYETSKGTIRFSLDDPPSDRLVRRLIKARVTEARKPRTK